MRLGDGIATCEVAPDLRRRRIEIGARRAQGGLGPSDQPLHGAIVAHRRQSLRLLAARKLDRGIERRARHAHRGGGKTHAEHRIGGELVERAFFAARGGIVAKCRKFVRDEEIVDRIGVGAGALEPDDVPDVVHRGARHREQDGADFRRAARLFPLAAVGLNDAHMRAKPARLPRAGGKVPARAGPVAAGNGVDFMGDRAPGQDPGRRVENFAGGIGVEVGRGHRADAALPKAPGGGGVGLGDLLLHLHEDFERRLRPPEALRQQNPVQPVLDQGGGHRGRQAPRALDLIGLARDQGLQCPGALDEIQTGMLAHSSPRPFYRVIN